MPFVIPNVTPLGIIALTINVVVAPLVAWLVKSGRKVARKITVQGVRLNAMENQVNRLQNISDAAEPRLARLETAICNIERAAEASKDQHAAVMQELKQLPRLATMLELYSTAIAAIVPRNEVDSRVKAVEDRLTRVELTSDRIPERR